MKKFQHIMQGLIVIAIIFATYMVGVYSTKYKQNKEDNKSTTTMIAVVNTDQGITVAGENVNYASDLIMFPDVNFTVTGLTDALQGIAENRYAAYILIPSTFSESVISVNREPQKVQVTYEINPNLREDAKMKVVGDIHNFLLALNTNISYIYVDSILHEVHAVQDGSAAVMENDTADMQAIIAVEQAELIEDVEYEPLKIPETEIEYMDLSDDYDEVDTAVDSIYTTYQDNIETAETEFYKIKESEKTINEELTVVGDIFTQVDILTDNDGNSVYEQGEENLSLLTEEFAYNSSLKKYEAKLILGYEGETIATPIPTISPIPESTPTQGVVPTPVVTPTITPTPTVTPTPTPEIQEPTPAATPTPTPEVQEPTPTAMPRSKLQEIYEQIDELLELLEPTPDATSSPAQNNSTGLSESTNNEVVINQLSDLGDDDGRAVITRLKRDNKKIEIQSEAMNVGLMKALPDIRKTIFMDELPNGAEGIVIENEIPEEEIPEETIIEDEDPKEETIIEDEGPKEETIIEDEGPKEETIIEDEGPKEETIIEDESSEEGTLEDTIIEDKGSEEETAEEKEAEDEIPENKLQEEVTEDKVSGNKTGQAKLRNSTFSLTGEDEEETLTQEEIDALIEGLEKLRTDVREYYESAIIAVDAIPDGTEIEGELQAIIQDEIAQPIMDECVDEASTVTAAIINLEGIIVEYIAMLEEYDAMSYIDRESIDEHLSSLYEIIGDMETEIVEQDALYLTYITDLETTADENITSLQDDLDTAYENTILNIDTTFEAFKTNRTNLNQQNIEVLDGITHKLPYTRLGDLEYRQVYDFIVEPIEENNMSKDVYFSPVAVMVELQDLICVFAGIIALMVIYVSVLLIHKKYQKEKLSGEEE